MEAALHVEKVRINPGNADKKKFAVQEYSDRAYAEEIERLYEAFSHRLTLLSSVVFMHWDQSRSLLRPHHEPIRRHSRSRGGERA